MTYRDSKALAPLISPARALAWSEARADEGVETVTACLWQPKGVTAVLGLSQNAEAELRLELLRADCVPVLRRSSGGGAVVLTGGVLCFEAVAPLRGLGIREAFAALTAPLLETLRGLGVPAELAGVSDLAAGGRKLAGCAQLRRKTAVLVHCSLLVNADLDLFEKYLLPPTQQPEYRAGRSHAEFCANLAEFVPEAEPERIANALAEDLRTRGWNLVRVPAEPDAAAARVYAAKFAREGWNLRRERE